MKSKEPSRRSKISALLKNILSSGYAFDESECIMRSKYVTVNAMLMLSLFIGPFFMYKIIMLRGSTLLYSIITFLSIMAFVFFTLRKKRDYYHYLVSIIPIIGLILGVASLSACPHEIMRVTWFFIVILVAFFLGGYKVGLPIYFFSVASISAVEYIVNTDMDVISYSFILLVLTLEAAGIYLYDQREQDTDKP